MALLVIGGAIVLVAVFFYYASHADKKEKINFVKEGVQGMLADPTSAKFWGVKLVQRSDNLLAVCGKVNRSTDEKSLMFFRFVAYETGKDNIWSTNVEGYLDGKVEMDKLYKKYCIDLSNQNIVIYEE